MADPRDNQGLCLGGWGTRDKVLNYCADAGEIEAKHDVLVSA